MVEREIPKTRGGIELICGSMFSGKTEELIRRLRRATFAKQTPWVFKPIVDTRYKEEKVTSHVGNEFDAKPVVLAGDILEITKNLNPKKDVIAIDEVQFFDEDIIDVVENLADKGFRVILAGLDTDFRGEPFGPMPRLMARAELVDKIHAICVVCSEEASRTQRIIKGKPASHNDPIVLVGATDSYEARCRFCHEVVPVKESHE